MLICQLLKGSSPRRLHARPMVNLSDAIAEVCEQAAENADWCDACDEALRAFLLCWTTFGSLLRLFKFRTLMTPNRLASGYMLRRPLKTDANTCDQLPENAYEQVRKAHFADPVQLSADEKRRLYPTSVGDSKSAQLELDDLVVQKVIRNLRHASAPSSSR